MLNYKNILVTGDNHGHWEFFPNFIRDYKLNDCAIFVAGDFGIGFEPMVKEISALRGLTRRMKYYNSVLYVVRGNHDNPEYFTGRFDSDYVKLLPDYTVLNINNLNILVVGGAYSIDRTDRRSYYCPRLNSKKSDTIAPNNYWITEKFNYDYDKIKLLNNIDYVITHSAPMFCLPYNKGSISEYYDKDKIIKEDCYNERKDINLMYDDLVKNDNKIKCWYYGHFHNHYENENNGTKFIGLNIDEVSEIKY